MARAHFGPQGMTWSGKAGNAIFRTVNGQTVIQQAPVPRNKEFTPKQKACQDNTREAGRYGKRALANPELRPLYEAIAAWEKKPVAAMANRDAFRAPVVEEIDASTYAGEPDS